MEKIIKNYLSQTALFGLAITAAILFWEITDGLNSLGQTNLNRIENQLYDYRFRFTLNDDNKESDTNIVILDIDEKSLQAEGRWAWSRVKIGKLVNKLAEHGALVVAFDIVFSEPERNPATEILENYPSYDIQSELQAIENIADADKAFANSFTNIDVVLGYFFNSENTTIGAIPPSVRDYGPEILDTFVTPTLPGIISNLPLLQDAAIGAGSVYTLPDADGVIRRSPLVTGYDGKLFPALSLAAGMAYLFSEDIELYTSELGGLTSITSIGISEYLANTDAQGSVLVPYIGKQKSFPYISATDVLNDNIEDGVLNSAIVLVGTSALGLRDLRTTPLETNYPGVEVHANILKGLLEGNIPFQPDWEAGLVRTLIILLGAFLALILPRLSSLVMIFTGISTLVIYQLINYYLWTESRFDLSQAPIVILILSITALNIGIGFFQESSRRKDLKDMFEQYVPPAHIDKMVSAEQNSNAFVSDSREMTVLFSDIRSFTSISEGLSAEQLKLMLNEYFTPITQIIFEREGTIDKYVGDMVMAFWGAPLEDSEHRLHALEAALSMLEKTEQLKQEFKEKGLPEINIGIGLNSGLMNVGDMGSKYRKAYTVLGDAVNLSSRLESLTKFYGVQCLVGENTIQGIKDFTFREIDRIQVKGKQEPVNVFEPIGRTSNLNSNELKELESYHSALSLYRAMQWEDAEKVFQYLNKQAPQTLIYLIYLERIAEYKAISLPNDWDSTFKHSTK